MGFMEIIYLSVVFPLVLMVEQEGYCLNAAGSSVHFPPFFWQKYVCDGWSLIQLDFSNHPIFMKFVALVMAVI